MLYKTVSDLNDSVGAMLQGLDLNSVTNLFTGYERTARQLAHEIDIQESEGRLNFVTYDGVTDYSAPEGIFGTTVIDLQPQGVSRMISDYNYKKNISDFDRNKSFTPSGSQISFEFRNGVEIMRVASARPIPKIELDPMTATTGWVAAGTASGFVLDSSVYYQQQGSLRFNLTGAGTGTLTKTISSTDLTAYLGVGVSFAAYRIPSTANLTSIAICIGSSSANYYTVSVTEAFLADFIANDWDLASFDLSGATKVGTPDITKIVYVQILIAHTGSITNFYLGDLWISLPCPNTLIFLTTNIFQASGSSPSSTIDSKADTILLTDEVYAIYELKCAVAIAAQQGGTLSSGIVAFLDQRLNGVRGYRGVLIQPGLLDLYRANNPTQRMKTMENWYND